MNEILSRVGLVGHIDKLWRMTKTTRFDTPGTRVLPTYPSMTKTARLGRYPDTPEHIPYLAGYLAGYMLWRYRGNNYCKFGTGVPRYYLRTYPRKTKTARFGTRVGTPEYSRVYALAVPGYYYLPEYDQNN